MNIKLLVDGGNMQPGPAIAQKLGPLGINMGKVISDINTATRDFQGMKLPVELDINEKTKEFTVKTFSPPTSELLKKELGFEKGSEDHKKVKVGNASIEDVIKITKVKYSEMLQREFKSAVKSILGTCASIGILVENEDPNELIQKIDKGEFEKEINEQLSETSPEKRKKIQDFFDKIKSEQEAAIAIEKAAAEEAEKAKTEEAAKEGEAKPEEARLEEGKEGEVKAEEKAPEQKK